MKKNPEQTEQTRLNLKDAYWKLFTADEKISVDAVCRVAGYNRCTFYRYYDSSGGILEEIERDLCSLIYTIAQTALEKDDPALFLKEMTLLFEDKGDYICTLLGENGDPKFVNMVKEQMAPVLLRFFQLEQNPHRDLLLTFFSSALSQTLSQWYKSGKKLPLEELTHFISGLIYGALSNIKQNQSPFAQPKPSMAPSAEEL